MNNNELLDFYYVAKNHVTINGYSDEIRDYERLNTANISESTFLCEYAWVVLNSGFRESTVRKIFNYFSLCFYDWESAIEISLNRDICVSLAKPVFNNQKKLEGIVRGIDIYLELGGITWVKDRLKENYRDLETLPFIGPITSKHLAKNLGLSIAKPDRHLERFASSINRSVDYMCDVISHYSKDDLRVVDTVLWRFFALQHNSSLRF